MALLPTLYVQTCAVYSFFCEHYDVSKCELKCQWLQENCTSRLYTSLIWFFSNDTAKTKFAIMIFLYSGTPVKTRVRWEFYLLLALIPCFQTTIFDELIFGDKILGRVTLWWSIWSLLQTVPTNVLQKINYFRTEYILCGMQFIVCEMMNTVDAIRCFTK